MQNSRFNELIKKSRTEVSMVEEKKESHTSDSKDVEENKVIAAIGYLGILFLVPLLAKKDSPYAQFHAKQGMVLFIFSIILGFIMIIPFLGWVIGAVGYLFTVVLFIMGLINALGGKKQPLPLIGQFAEQIKI